MHLSIILCTHNPRPDYLHRTLDALQAQSLSRDQWELLLIDNASKEPLASLWDLSWHPHARHIREEELGLTPARFRGIREASAEVLVFVDDDNVLAPDYLTNALQLTRSHPWVGAFGGNTVGEFETQPESWAEAMLPYLAVVEVRHEEWAFGPGTSTYHCVPCGAGMVIRKTVSAHYVKLSAHDPLRRGFDRKGASLAGAGDYDMAFCACLLGLAIGRFPQLQLTHLIPSRRVQREYLLKLAEEAHFSHTLLQHVWNGQVSEPPRMHQSALCRSERWFLAYKALRSRFQKPRPAGFKEEFDQAVNRGVLRAAELLKS